METLIDSLAFLLPFMAVLFVASKLEHDARADLEPETEE